jgi:hypothetical protein
MLQTASDVMLSESEVSAFPAALKKADSSHPAQNDILTRFHREKAR